MSTHLFVGSNHAGDTEARQSQDLILLLCNTALIICFRKRYKSVEAPTFFYEFTAMKNSVDIIE